MKANDFFKKHGLAEVKILLTSPSHGFFFKEDFYKHYGFDIYDDLKRLVESHDLVKDYYGLTRAKEHAESNYTAPETKDALKQAITDVEACKEVS